MLRTVRQFVFATTPTILRAIADRLDQDMQNTRVGDTVPNYVEYGPDCELRITIDQDVWNHEQAIARKK